MQSLVFIENGRPVTDTLSIAETFGKRHDRVLQDVRELDCSQEFRLHHFVESTYINSQNREMPRYLMTEQGFAFMVMGYTGKEAARFKELYINEFHRMRDELNKPTIVLPQTYKEALIALVSEVEKNEKLETEKLMLEQRVAEYEPKATYVDQILKSTSTVAITQIAKDYGLTGQKLNEILHEEHVQYKINGQWLLYREHQDKGYTKSHTVDIFRSDGRRDVKMNTQWTQKGRLLIHEILVNRGILPYMDRKNAG